MGNRYALRAVGALLSMSAFTGPASARTAEDTLLLVAVAHWSGDGDSLGRAEYRYARTPEGLRRTAWIQDSLGNEALAGEEVLDSAGRIIFKATPIEGTAYANTVTTVYGPGGGKVREQYGLRTDTGIIQHRIMYFENDARGNPVREFADPAGPLARLQMIHRNAYDGRGRLVSVETWVLDTLRYTRTFAYGDGEKPYESGFRIGDSTACTRHRYRPDGRPAVDSVHDYQGILRMRFVYEYARVRVPVKVSSRLLVRALPAPPGGRVDLLGRRSPERTRKASPAVRFRR